MLDLPGAIWGIARDCAAVLKERVSGCRCPQVPGMHLHIDGSLQVPGSAITLTSQSPMLLLQSRECTKHGACQLGKQPSSTAGLPQTMSIGLRSSHGGVHAAVGLSLPSTCYCACRGKSQRRLSPAHASGLCEWHQNAAVHGPPGQRITEALAPLNRSWPHTSLGRI